MESRLTPEQFKALIELKGWTQGEVAALFGKSRVWLNTIGRNPDRPAHYDFAVMGLPNKRTFAREITQLKRRLDAATGGAPLPASRKVAGDYRYHGYLTVGAIVTATEDVGSLAEAGSRGIVFAVEDTGQGERYGVIFETGGREWFAPAFVDTFLATTGLDCPTAVGYQFRDDSTLLLDFTQGKFSFWPTAG